MCSSGNGRDTTTGDPAGGAAEVGGAAHDSGAGAPEAIGGAASNSGGAPSSNGGSAGAASDGGTGTGPAPGSGESVTLTVGKKGGSVVLDASAGTAVLTIPEGAVAKDTEITITETTDAAPTGYTMYSPVYQFEPAGLTFAKPLTITLPFDGVAKLATLFWSRSDGKGFERIGGIATSGLLNGSAAHFSKGFVADGVDYTDPPDLGCVVGKLVEGRTRVPGAAKTTIESSVALFFTVDDCQGRPITGLECKHFPDQCAFSLKEDGVGLSSEADASILQIKGLNVFARLLLDMSSSTMKELSQVIAGAKAFVQSLQIEHPELQVQIAVDLFAGEANVTEWQTPTLDSAKVLARLDALDTYVPADPSSTNLYGAVIESLSKLSAAEQAFQDRNNGGALAAGYLVIFTDGADTAGVRTQAQAQAAEQALSLDQVLAVGLKSSPDFSQAAQDSLAALTGNGQGLIPSDDPTTLERDFSALAVRIAGQVKRTYQLGYCSPKRSGTHTVAVEVAGATNQAKPSFDFSASGFGPNCAAAAFGDACDGLECGGLACGACDDRNAACDAAGQCQNFCSSLKQCGGTAIVNPRGYDETCNDQPQSTRCKTLCVDTTTDNANCGACSNACNAQKGLSCRAGTCACADGYLLCGASPNELCTKISEQNCGQCGNVCPAAVNEVAMCIDGTCRVATTLATSQVFGIATNATNAYWTDGSAVRQVDLNGSATSTLVPTQGGAASIVVRGASVYWATSVPLNAFGNTGGIFKASLDDGIPVPLATGQTKATALAVDATAAYWLTGSGQVMKVALAGGAPIELAKEAAQPDSLAIDTNSVYWPLGYGDQRGAIKKVGLGGGMPVTLCQDVSPRSIVTDGTNVYWTNSTSIMKVSVNGGTPKPILSGLLGPSLLTKDQNNFYWMSSVNGMVPNTLALMKASVSGGTPTTLVPFTTQGYTSALAVDGTSIYWGEQPNSLFRKTAK